MNVSEEIKKKKKKKKNILHRKSEIEKKMIRSVKEKIKPHIIFFHPDPLRFYCANKIVTL